MATAIATTTTIADALCVCFQLFITFFIVALFSLGAQNKCTKFLLCCLKCCFWCLEKFIKFLNRNAYIMVRQVSQSYIPWGISLMWTSKRSLSHNSILNCSLWKQEVMSFLSLSFNHLNHLVSSGSHIWQKLLHFSPRCLLSSNEKYHKVRQMGFKGQGTECLNLVKLELCLCHMCPAQCLFCSHPYRVAVLDKVTDFLLFLGKLLIVGLVGEWKCSS